MSVPAGDGHLHYDMNDAENIFTKFTKHFKRQYKNQKDQYLHFGHFKQISKIINDLNAKYYPDTTFSVNLFAKFSKKDMKKWFEDHKG